jgi:hypothetical protein
MPATTPPPTLPTIRPSNLVFREYPHRTRRKLTQDISLTPLEPWYTWDWSQLTMPVWVVASYPDYGDSTTQDNAMND